jgi:4-hydroxybenzoate polyprenyltransferase
MQIQSAKPVMRQAALPVLAVDLDGTLLKTDVLLESLIDLLRRRPWYIFLVPFWWLKGTAHLKHQIARRTALDVTALPYREDFIAYLKTRRAQGCFLVLATAADFEIARRVADHLGLFDEVLASDGVTNLNREAKRERLVREFGEKGFDYAGNSSRDLPVWAAGRRAIVVDSNLRLAARVRRVAVIDRVFRNGRPRFADLLIALRPQHWVKNLLLFVPLIAAHRISEFHLWSKLVLAFFAFGCVASSGYLINDLHDLAADRRHPHKRFRAFASGNLPLSYALAMIPILLGLACAIGTQVSGLFVASMATYFGLSLAYTLWVRRILILDVIFLAGLYTVRILAGSSAVAIWPSHWLLAFSTFLFFSLALVKRYGELCVMKRADGDHATARAYELTDAELLAAMGVASGYLAVLVLALYINSDKAPMLYGRYQLIWLLCPLLLYWISDIWLIAHRGKMPDDPVVFAMQNRTSRILLLAMFAICALAL